MVQATNAFFVLEVQSLTREREREFFIDNLLVVRIHLIIEMI